MGLFSLKKAVIGIVLMTVGTFAMLPGMLLNSAQVMSRALIVDVGTFTLGTWMIGTSEDGHSV